MTETTEQIKQQSYEEGKVYSLSDFMDIKAVHFDIIVDKLHKTGYIKKYGFIINNEGKYIETPPTMTTKEFNTHSFQYIITQLVGLRVGRLICKDDEEALKYIQSDNVSDKRYITTDFKISDIEENPEYVMTDWLYQTCIFSIQKNGSIRLTFREIPNSPIEYQSIPQ